MNKNVSDTIGITNNYSISEYLNSLLDEELYLLIRINYCNDTKEILKNPGFKKLLKKVTEYSNNIDTTLTIYCNTLPYIEKEVTKRWVKYIEKRRVK